MNEREIMEYIHANYPLSQAFLLEMIPTLFDKGFYELLIDDGIEALDLILRNDTNVKKIHAHALGSHQIGKYDKAYELLCSINSDNDLEIIDMQTSAISNMRRFQLTDTNLPKEKIKEILQTILKYYQAVLNSNETKHYYPGVNIAYLQYADRMIFQTQHNVKSILEQSLSSIDEDKNSSDSKKHYYAHISYIELLLLCQDSSYESRLEEFLLEIDLDKNENKFFYIAMLERTSRQMEFYIKFLEPYTTDNDVVYSNLQKAFRFISEKIFYS